MKQILQSFRTGKTELVDVPLPKVSRGSLLIKTTHTLVSLGTERMLVEFGKSSLISKARQQPDKVKMVLDKVKSDGLLPTIETVFNKLDEPLPLGYCNSGIVVAVGDDVDGFSIGDRVASNGNHAEYVCVPKNLVAKIPGNVTQEEAAFTVIGSIGLQGIRLCNPSFGETIVVIGLGLIGLLTVQLLRANGCRVIGLDIDDNKCALARKTGAHVINTSKGTDPVKAVLDLTENIGADGVIITASAKNNEIISQSAKMSRKRGRIILVGVVGLNIDRSEFYQKELVFQVSCSYGPGRYDENYEQKGIDYPLPFVRWTEKRNFETILDNISTGSLNVKELITEQVDIADYLSIYDNIGQSKSIASLLRFSDNTSITDTGPGMQTIILNDKSFKESKGVIGVIGSGNFAKMTMLPALKGSGAEFKYIASSKGVSGTMLARKFGFSHSTTDYKEILADKDVDVIFISTRHNSHAELVIESLKAGKHVFVEKPLAITEVQFGKIISHLNLVDLNNTSITIGFNRRFSPHTQFIKKSLGENPGPININATMNAGFIPPDVWIHDMEIGGGRIIGEACHYIDLCVYLTGSQIESVCMNSMGKDPQQNTDNASILLKFKNGSNAVVNYFANGSKAYSKERVEVFSAERTWVLDNFRSTKAFGVKGPGKLRTKINKGHKNQFYEYIKRIKTGGDPIISINEILNVTQASFAAIRSLKENKWIKIKQTYLDYN
ncbi:MAG: bi-domain-containing oxidoreductase [Cyclobacteriaceae bacterium]